VSRRSSGEGGQQVAGELAFRLGYLDQDDSTRKYRFGIRVLDLSFSVLGAAVNLAFPWSPVAMSELADQFGPVLQATARQISALVI
jgi:DNA-binding IclR family transcriptional regulator